MLRTTIGLLALTLLSPAYAAESYDNCTGTISSLPATISTQGTWCLKDNLATTISTGAAITIATNNVTIDCNDFRFGGLGAGPGTQAWGILVNNSLNATVRNCGIRGFLQGIRVSGTASGALIEHNRLDQNTSAGVLLDGSGHIVRFNRIVDTGGSPTSAQTYGVLSLADQSQVTDNTIVGMTNDDLLSGSVTGISSSGDTNEVARNYITGLVQASVSTSGIVVAGNGNTIHRNQLFAFPGVDGAAIDATDAAVNQCSNNNYSGFANGISNCANGGGNYGTGQDP
jgi:hypothetical protein